MREKHQTFNYFYQTRHICFLFTMRHEKYLYDYKNESFFKLKIIVYSGCIHFVHNIALKFSQKGLPDCRYDIIGIKLLNYAVMGFRRVGEGRER